MGFKVRQVAGQRNVAIRPGLGLRTLSLDDADELFALVEENRSYLREWMSWLDVTTTVEGIRPFIQSCVDGYTNGTSFRWALLVDGTIGGVVGLEDITEMHKRAKIGYWQSQEHQGRGGITDAVRFLLHYGFGERDLNLIEIRAAAKNTKSRAVAMRVGMKLDGVLRQREWLYDHYVDLASYTLLATEWRSSPSMAAK